MVPVIKTSFQPFRKKLKKSSRTRDLFLDEHKVIRHKEVCLGKSNSF